MVVLGQATETDTAQPLTSSKTATASQAFEVDSVLAAALSKLATTGQPIEANSALAASPSKVFFGGLSQERNALLPLAAAKTITLGQATEANSSFPIATMLSKAVGQAAETDTVLSAVLSKAVVLGQAVEVDSVRILPLMLPTLLKTTTAEGRGNDATAMRGVTLMVTGPKRGDLAPNLIIDIGGATGNLNTVLSWRLICKRPGLAGTFFVNAAPDVAVNPIDNTKAIVTHTWTATQTATAGVLQFEVEAMWPGNRPQTFPSVGQVEVQIWADLDT